MGYSRHAPAAALSPWVSSLWVQQNPADASTRDFRPTRVVPTGAAGLAFYFHEPFAEVSSGSVNRLGSAVLSGPQTTFREYAATGRTGIVLVQFHPGAASAFLTVPMSEVVDRDVDLGDCISSRRTAQLTGLIRSAVTEAERVNLVQSFLLSLLRPDRPCAAVHTAVAKILDERGSVAVPAVARSVGLGSRQLQRRFREHVGISPKAFGRTIRFQHALELHAAGLTWSMTALEAGYHDQSHLANECRALTGLSPEQVFRRRRGTPLGDFFNHECHGHAGCSTVYL